MPAEPGDHESEVDGGTDVELVADASGTTMGRLVRVREPLRVGVVTEVRRPTSPYAVAVVSLRVENRTRPTVRADEHRPDWLRLRRINVGRTSGVSLNRLQLLPQWTRVRQ